MSIILISSLTLALIWPIIIRMVRKRRNYFAKVVYTQSSIHQVIKPLLPPDLFELPKRDSQATKHVAKNTVRVMIVEGQAYWVHNNMFYTAETLDGFVDPDTTRPIDTNNMSNRDIDKMLFILDSLKGGNSDDSSSTGNK